MNRGILPQQTSQIYMYTSFFKRERQHDPFRAKEIINRGILQQQTSQIYMYTSFFYPASRVSFDLPRQTDLSRKIDGDSARRVRSLSASDNMQNMTRLERKKLSIDGYCNNKLARYTCIARSLSVSDTMTRLDCLERKKLSIDE